jgi:hypothetical protein
VLTVNRCGTLALSLKPHSVTHRFLLIIIIIDYYLKNIEELWPIDQFHYQEEVALFYLHLKEYDVEHALTSLIFNIDELIKLLISKIYY